MRLRRKPRKPRKPYVNDVSLVSFEHIGGETLLALHGDHGRYLVRFAHLDMTNAPTIRRTA